MNSGCNDFDIFGTGKPSIQKALKIRDRREQEAELAELQQNEIIQDKVGRRERAAVAKISRQAEEALEKLRVILD